MLCRIFLIFILTYNFSFAQEQSYRPQIRKQLLAIDTVKNDSIAVYRLEQLLHTAKLSPEETLRTNARIISRSLSMQKLAKALRLAMQGINIARENKLDSLEGAFNALTGVTYYYMERRKETIPYMKEAIRIGKEHGLWEMEAGCRHNLAAVFIDLGEFKEGEEYLVSSMKIRSQHGQEQNHNYLLSLRVLATLYDRLNKKDEAEKIYSQLIQKARQMKDTSLLASDLIFYSGFLNKQGRYSEAAALSGEALTYLRLGKDFHGLIANLNFHSKNLEALGQYKEALEITKEAFLLQKKTFAGDLEKEVSEMEVKYKTKEKENRIKLQQAEIKAQETKTIYLIVSFLLVIALGILLFSRHRLRVKHEIQEEKIRQERLRIQSMIRSQEEERRRVSRELHDGLGQMLSAARLQLASLENEKGEASVEIKKAKEMLDESCAEVRSISHDLMPALLSKNGLIAALNELSAAVQSPQFSIYLDHDDNIGRMIPETEVHLFRIIQELLNNIIKYAEATVVHVQVTKEDDNQLSVLIEDNGKGFDKSELEKGKGNGWNNIQSRLELIGGTIEIDSRQGNGTVVHIQCLST